MSKIKKRIEIVTSTKPGLGSLGPKSRAAVRAVLAGRYARVDVTIVNSVADLTALAARKPDMVFLGMKYIPADAVRGLTDPRKVWVGEYLATAGIAFTGSDHSAIELELHKELAKQRLLGLGLKTSRFQIIRAGYLPAEDTVSLSYPLFVKPSDRGGGKGVDAGSLVYNLRQLQTKVRALAANLQCDALVEEYLPGREFSVGILKQLNSAEYAVMPLEIVAPLDESGARFLSSQIKTADTEQTFAVTSEMLKAKLNALAIAAFHALGAQDYGRIDIRLDAAGVPNFLEANLLPCLIDGYGNFPKACQLNIGLPYESMILRIVDLAFARCTDGILEESAPTVISDRAVVFTKPILTAL